MDIVYFLWLLLLYVIVIKFDQIAILYGYCCDDRKYFRSLSASVSLRLRSGLCANSQILGGFSDPTQSEGAISAISVKVTIIDSAS